MPNFGIDGYMVSCILIILEIIQIRYYLLKLKSLFCWLWLIEVSPDSSLSRWTSVYLQHHRGHYYSNGIRYHHTVPIMLMCLRQLMNSYWSPWCVRWSHFISSVTHIITYRNCPVYLWPSLLNYSVLLTLLQAGHSKCQFDEGLKKADHQVINLSTTALTLLEVSV